MTDIPIIVTLTTISSRVVRLDVVIKSLLEQTIRPDRVVLNISEAPYLFDKGMTLFNLSPWLRNAVIKGQVELYQVENTGPYRKLIPTLRRFRDQSFLAVTADDDVIYPPQWLEGLLAGYREYGCVVAYRCRRMPLTLSGAKPYHRWELIGFNSVEVAISARRGLDLMPTGRGGIMYRSDFFDELDLLDCLRMVAPKQDDIAFRLFTLAKGIEVFCVPVQRAGVSDPEFRDAGHGADHAGNLWVDNVGTTDGLSPNDRAISAVANFLLKRGCGQNLNALRSEPKKSVW